MSGIIELDSNFKIPGFFDISDFENLKVYKHVYGQSKDDDPDHIYWLEYQISDQGSGTISFARRLYLDYPEIAEYVIEYLSALFPSIPFDVKRVNLLKTKGSIPKHVDESFRSCAVNIGIKNSSTAITRTSRTKSYHLFNEQSSDFICKDGHSYLLDTGSIHEVISLDESSDRFLFTYGFGRNFDEISRHIRK
jgi:hypothetical protein